MMGKPSWLWLAVCASLALAVPRATMGQASGDTWRFTAGLYVWLPTVNADLKYGLPPGQPGSPEVEIGPNNYLTNLNIAVPLVAEARKGNFSIFTDVLYLSLTSEGSRIKDVAVGPDRFPVPGTLESGTESDIKGLEWTMVGGWTVAKSPGGNLDLFGGVRYLGPKITTNWHLSADFTLPGGNKTFTKAGSIEKRADLWDGIVGVRGRVRIAEKWSLPYYADIGGGSSKLTWQAYGGIDYSFSKSDLMLVYRHLSYEGKEDSLTQKLNLGGLALAFLLHF